MTKIKFGTDGWRAIIADDFTVANVQRVAAATALWIKQNTDNHKAIVGYDCRFGGELFAKATATVLCNLGIEVLLADNFATTPMVSLATIKLGAYAGIIITASHNPASYNGYKVKANYGGPALVSEITKIENLIADQYYTPIIDFEQCLAEGKVSYFDIETVYLHYVKEHFDLAKLQPESLLLTYDAMYGSGQFIAKRIFKNTHFLHCEFNPGFDNQAPEPLQRNLKELENKLVNNPSHLSIITDGDADRIAFYDDKSAFVDAHHILLLTIYYLHNFKKMSGKVVIAFSVSERIKRLCEHYQIPCQVTPIGFKYIAEVMLQDDVLVGGEESGGIAVKGHIPERDGIWMSLLLLELMQTTNKKISEIINDIYKITGAFCYERWDLHISIEQKTKIIAACKANEYSAFGQYQVANVESIDGYKFHIDATAWVMLRLSGTEPVLRIYAEATTKNQVLSILQAAKDTVLA